MELRKDYILDRWVYLATERKKRPREFKPDSKQEDEKICYFCPGNEESTPPEKGRLEENGKWIIRWFNNKFAAVEQKGKSEITTADIFFTFSDAFGEHEVIAETNDHKKQLWDLDTEHIAKLLNIYNQRISELEKIQGVKYVSVFKNHGINAGTSLVHSHTQVMALNNLPSRIREKIEASKKYESCPYCDILKKESQGERKAFENDYFTAFCPYASRFNYEIWIFPKTHIKKMDELNKDQTKGLADILKKVISKLKEIDASYNYFIQYSPEEDMHFHIEVCPRIARWAGFEFSTDAVINSVSPESAAKFYRGEE